jgi:hypothetical protein
VPLRNPIAIEPEHESRLDFGFDLLALGVALGKRSSVGVEHGLERGQSNVDGGARQADPFQKRPA